MRRVFAFLFLAVLGLAPATAQAEDLYSVKDIPVDASAAASSEAQAAAINSGRARAFDILFKRIVRQQDWAKKPQLDDLSLQRLVRSYTVANERRSTTRYTGKVTYIFNPDAVRRLFRSKAIPFVDVQAKPVLVIPMAPNYAVHGAWTDMIAANKTSSAVTLALPLGDAMDSSALTGIDFSTVSWQDLEPLASRQQATEAYLVLATAGGGQITVKIRRVGPGASPPISDVIVPVAPGTPAQKSYGDAAKATAAAIASAWKMRSAIDFSQRSRLTADVAIESLPQWGQMLQKLSTIPTITEVNVVAMNMGMARVSLVYAGSADQLRDALSQASFDLSAKPGGGWTLTPAQVPLAMP
ncbi:MAG: DUF2066 domain-containing protein [Alphaproteobacteria bacterium]|nr:DUF2066 domain-containing protein [Alphaproteobacteria bacterium]